MLDNVRKCQNKKFEDRCDHRFSGCCMQCSDHATGNVRNELKLNIMNQRNNIEQKKIWMKVYYMVILLGVTLFHVIFSGLGPFVLEVEHNKCLFQI